MLRIVGSFFIFLAVIACTVPVSKSGPAPSTAGATTSSKDKKYSLYNKIFPSTCSWMYDIPSEASEEKENPILFKILKVTKAKDKNESSITISLVKPYVRNKDITSYFVRKKNTKEKFKPVSITEIENKPNFTKENTILSFHIYLYGYEVVNLKGIEIFAKGIPKSKKVEGQDRWTGKFSDLKLEVKLAGEVVIKKAQEYKWITDLASTKPAYYAVAMSPTVKSTESKQGAIDVKIKVTHNLKFNAGVGVYLQEDINTELNSSLIFLEPGEDDKSYYIVVRDGKLLNKEVIVGFFIQGQKQEGEKLFRVKLEPGTTINLKGRGYKEGDAPGAQSDSLWMGKVNSAKGTASLTVFLKDERSWPIIDKQIYATFENGDRFYFGISDTAGKIIQPAPKNQLFRLYSLSDPRYKFVQTKDIVLKSDDRTINMVLPRAENKIWLRVVDKETGTDIGGANVKIKRSEKVLIDLYVTPKYGDKYYYCRKYPIYPDETFDIFVDAPGKRPFISKSQSFNCSDISENGFSGCTGLSRSNPIVIEVEPAMVLLRPIVKPFFVKENKRFGSEDVMSFDSNVNAYARCAKNKKMADWIKFEYDKERAEFPGIFKCSWDSNFEIKVTSKKFNPFKDEYDRETSDIEPNLMFKKPILYVIINPNSRLLLGKEGDEDPLETFAWIKNKFYDLSKTLDTKPPWKELWSLAYYSTFKADDDSPTLLAKRGLYFPQWGEESHRKSLIENITPGKGAISYIQLATEAIDFFDGFSLSEDRIKGVVLIVMGAPASDVSFQELSALEKMFQENQLIALIAQFKPTAMNPSPNTAVVDGFANIKIVSYGLKKEKHNYFGSALGNHLKGELKKLLQGGGIKVK